MAPTLISRCHCGKNTIPLEVPLPLHTYICHCTSCRIRTGTMYVHNALVSSSIPFTRDSPPPDLQVYTPSPEPGSTKDGSLFFCRHCSTLLFMCWGYTLPTGEKKLGWAGIVAAMSLDESNPDNKGKKTEDVIQMGAQFVVSDTVDGGAAPWTINWDGPPVCKYGPHKTDLLTKDELLNMEKETNKSYATSGSPDKELRGQCYCKSVKVVAKRDDPKQKFIGSHCACDSCRILCGVDMMSFLHVPAAQIGVEGSDGSITPWPKTEPQSVREAFPQIKVYESSKDAFRGSCATCGSNVFWQGTGYHEVEPAAGMFGYDDTKGIRREDWVDWKSEKSNISWVKDSVNSGRSKILVDHFVKAFEEWKKTNNV